VDRILRETGQLTRRRREDRLQINATTEERTLTAFRVDPSMSIRNVSGVLSLLTTIIQRSLNRNLYYVQRVQGLTENDYDPRFNFCQWFMNELERMPTFSKIILFTDEAAFDRDDITNFHNTHEWMEVNSHAIVKKKTPTTVVWFGEESLTIHLLDYISLKTD